MNEERQSKKCLIKWSIIVLALALILKVSYELKWLDVILGIFKLESKPDSIQDVSLKTNAYITRSGNEIAFLEMMESKGWHFVKHYGRGMLFKKESYELIVTKRNYFGKYAFYEVTSQSIFEMA